MRQLHKYNHEQIEIIGKLRLEKKELENKLDSLSKKMSIS